MAPLTPADVKRWDPEAIHGVFQTATNRASSLQTLGDNLQQVHLNLSEWHGDSGDAFRADLGKTRHDIEADGHESRQVAAAVSRAEADVRAVKSELDGIEQSAHECGFTIASDWRIDTGGAKLENAKLLAQQQLQTVLDVCKLHAHSADQELAAAIRSAVRETPVGVTPSPLGAGQPKTLQDMLLPAGPARPQTGGDPAKGPPIPGEAHGGATPSLQDMLLGRGEPVGAGGPSGDPLELLSRIPPGTRGIPPPPLKPAEIESFKAMARQTMINDGVPPDQIEARLDAVVGQTQQWLDAGAPNYVAPEGPRPPPPGFGEAFGDRWFASEQGVKNLFGQGGPGAPGVVESWTPMLKGTLETVQNPMGAAVDEFKHAVGSPSLAYYLGEKSADVAFNAPAMMFGPETLGLRAGLGEAGTLDALSGVGSDLPGAGSTDSLLPNVHSSLSPLDTPLRAEPMSSGLEDGAATNFVDPSGPTGFSPPSIRHPSGSVEGPASAGSAGHPSSEPAQIVSLTGHPADSAVPPSHSEVPVTVGHASAAAEVPQSAGPGPNPASMPVAADHTPMSAGSHAQPGPMPRGVPDPPPPTGDDHIPLDVSDHDHLSNENASADSNHGGSPYPVDSEGHYLAGSLPSYEELQKITSTDPNQAYYWSGRNSDGIGVGPDDSGIAELIAHGSGGVTLEMALEANGVDPLPVWNRHDPVSVQFWEDASAAYAENAHGEVTAIIGTNLRPGNIWQTVEIPRLMENPEITRILQIDPDTGQSITIFERGK